MGRAKNESQSVEENSEHRPCHVSPSSAAESPASRPRSRLKKSASPGPVRTKIEYVLFEAAPRIGGVMVTDRADGCLIEAGPDSFLTEKPWAADLCRKIGLGDQLIGSNDADRKTYIVVKNKLVVMPDGLMFMVPTKILPTVLSPLFSLRTKMRMAAEWFHPPHKAEADETVAQMVERHYGSEMVDLLADPLLSGVYGGEATDLSVRAVLPRFADMESKHGSLGRAMLGARKKMATATRTPPRPLFTSLKEGMQQMVDALVARLDPANLSHVFTRAVANPAGQGMDCLRGIPERSFRCRHHRRARSCCRRRARIRRRQSRR